MFQNETKNNYWYLAVFAVFAFVLWQSSETPPKADLSSHHPQAMKKQEMAHDMRVNKYLRSVDEKINRDSSRVMIENYHKAPRLKEYGALIRGSGHREKLLNYGVAMDQADEAEQVYNQIYSQASEDENMPDEIINRRVRERQLNDEADYQAKNAILKSFERMPSKPVTRFLSMMNFVFVELRKFANTMF